MIMPMLKEEYKKEEKINGVTYSMSPSANYRHGIVNGNLHAVIFNGLKGNVCRVFMENLDYKYHPDINDDYIIPDIMIVCDRKHLKGSAYTGVPKFVVETLSPATSMRDMTVKKDIYESCGVEEYWIVSPKERAVQIYYLEDGKYVLRYSYILEDDKDDRSYNANVLITLRGFPDISMTLADIFDGVEE